MATYYIDTCIWLDFFEDRNEPDFLKTDIAHDLLARIIKDGDVILVSDIVIAELESVGYSRYEIEAFFRPLRALVVFVESSDKDFGIARDLAAKRSVPRGDALHALIARRHKAAFISYDTDFQKLRDIIRTHAPREFV